MHLKFCEGKKRLITPFKYGACYIWWEAEQNENFDPFKGFEHKKNKQLHAIL